MLNFKIHFLFISINDFPYLILKFVQHKVRKGIFVAYFDHMATSPVPADLQTEIPIRIRLNISDRQPLNRLLVRKIFDQIWKIKIFSTPSCVDAPVVNEFYGTQKQRSNKISTWEQNF